MCAGIVLSSCMPTDLPSGYYAYDREEASGFAQSLKFQPELPRFIPFQSASMITEENEITFLSAQNDVLTLQVFPGNPSFPMMDPVMLEIPGKGKAAYVNNRFAQKLSWTKNGIAYLLVYRMAAVRDETNEQSVTRQHLVEVAHSFH